MRRELCLLLISLAVTAVSSPVGAQTVLFDFEPGSPEWGSYGPNTTDKGFLPFGSVGQGWFHSGDFDAVGWGIVDVSPLNSPLDLSGFSGISVDARLVNPPPAFPPYSGHMLLDIGLGFGPGAATEFYAPPVTLTDTYQTFAVPFAAMQLGPGANLTQAIIKLRFLNDDFNTGHAEFDYDEITGLPIVIVDGDYNHNGVVDAADYTVYRDTLGQSGSGLAADGNNSGTIDADDYNVWKSHFGNTAGSGTSTSGTVPEPATLVLLILAAAGGYVRRRQTAWRISELIRV